MSILPVGFGASDSTYQITNSLRVRASASAYLSKTFSTNPTDNGKGTFSFWVKRGRLGTTTHGLLAATGGAGTGQFTFQSDDTLYFQPNQTTTPAKQTTRVFRDPTAHLHFVYSWDTSNTQNGSPKQQRLWVNGVEETAFSTDQEPTRNLTGGGWFSNGVTLRLLAQSTNYFDGLCSEFYGIDGQDLTAADFGETNADGVWVPKTYTGTYGTNGFKLDFKDAAVTSGSNAGLGKDVSGNGNYFDTTNISVTAGVTYDQMTDTPTNNYATLNPLQSATYNTLSAANLRSTGSATDSATNTATIGSTTVPFYYEATVIAKNGGGDWPMIGASVEIPPNGNAKVLARSASNVVAGVVYQGGGQVYKNTGTLVGTYTALAANDVLGVGIDPVNGTADFYLNGTFKVQVTGITGSIFFPAIEAYNSGSVELNFGQRPFSYTNAGTNRPASTYKSLCTANLSSVAIKKPASHFDAKTRTGTGATFSVTGIGFEPGLVWPKGRSGATDHALYDMVRGVEKRLESNNTDAEVTGDTTGLTAFNSDGFTGGALAQINTNAATYIDWLWKAGGAPTTDNVAGAGNTPTAGSVKIDGANLGSALAGSIAATRLSANTTAGFSIVTYTGTGANATVAHGLSAAPKMVIVKRRSSSGTNWAVWHTGLTATERLELNATDAKSTDATAWNSTTPSSTVFSLGSAAGTNTSSATHVAYCFAEIAGFSKFGSYVGNSSSDGTFVYLGFRPAFLMIKVYTGGTGDWVVVDCRRNGYNEATKGNAALFPNTSGVESYADTGSGDLDILSNGFKPRSNNSNVNSSSFTYIYAAFAEHPFGGSNVSPSPAR
jgi:hypothetical protein